jgi:drug/metabolite transporter (DMT)-like permease
MLVLSIVPSNPASKRYCALPTSEANGDAGDVESDRVLVPSVQAQDEVSKSVADIGTPKFNGLVRIVSKYGFVVGWIAMVLAIFSGAGSGPMFKYMEEHGIAPVLAGAWRCQCMSIFLIPLAFLEIWKNNGETIKFFDRKEDLPFPVWVHTVIAGMLWSGTLLLWINSLKYLSTTQASLIVNTHPLIMVFYMQFTGMDVGYLDWLGVLISIAGVGVVGSDELIGSVVTEDVTSSPMMQLVGVAMCLGAAVCEFLVILNRKQIKKYVPLMQVRSSQTT